MDDIKVAFTNYIHDIIDISGMSYAEAFDFFVLKNALAKDNPVLRQDIFDYQLYQVQRISNNINLREAQKIIEFGESVNIKIVFMKGLFLADKLFGDINLRRSTDIDLLVDENELKAIYDFLIENGYTYFGGKDLLESGRKCHLKFTKIFGGLSKILIEIHTNANNPPYLFCKFSRKAYESAIRVNSLNLTPFVFSDIDQVIHLLLHFTQHTTNLTEKLENFNYTISAVLLKNLYDVCLLIHIKDISFNELEKRIEETETISSVYYGLKCINEIMSNFIPQKLLNKYRLISENNYGAELEILDEEKLYINELLSKTLKESVTTALIKNPRNIKFDYSDVLTLNRVKQRMFEFNDGKFNCCAEAVIDNDLLKIDLSFSKIQELQSLNEYTLVVHYRIAEKTELELFRKLKIRVFKVGNDWQIDFSQPWERIVLKDINGNVLETNINIILLIGIPLKYFITYKITTYSIDFVDAVNLCVTGTKWDDFDSMKHFRIDAL